MVELRFALAFNAAGLKSRKTAEVIADQFWQNVVTAETSYYGEDRVPRFPDL